MWGIVRRVLAGVGLIVALAGIGIFVATIVGAWQVKAETNQKTAEFADQAHKAVDAADSTLGVVRRVLNESRTDLQTARDQAAKTAKAGPPTKVNPIMRLTARRASENLAGSVDRANVAITTASDAAVVAEAALRVFGDDEHLKALKDWLGVKPEQLSQTRTGLTTAGRELQQVQTLLGVPTGGGPTQEQLEMVESALNQATEFTDQMGTIVATARVRVDEAKRTVDWWALRLAIGVTVVGVLGALGQFFMARFCWRTLRGKPA
jgi:hypothetical protein